MAKTNTLNVLNFSTCITLTFKLYSHTILPTVVQYYHNIEIILLKCNRKICVSVNKQPYHAYSITPMNLNHILLSKMMEFSIYFRDH